jgi:hypothetical protein
MRAAPQAETLKPAPSSSSVVCERQKGAGAEVVALTSQSARARNRVLNWARSRERR